MYTYTIQAADGLEYTCGLYDRNMYPVPPQVIIYLQDSDWKTYYGLLHATGRYVIQSYPPLPKPDHNPLEVFVHITRKGDRVNVITTEYLGYTSQQMKNNRQPDKMKIICFILKNNGISVEDFRHINHLEESECMKVEDDKDLQKKLDAFFESLNLKR